jgi:nicotinate-nucleotide pyrophosphorylase (carboxylating)
VIALHPVSRAVGTALVANGLDPDAVADLVARALAEDLGSGDDVTTKATVSPGQRARAEFVSRMAGTTAGIHVALAVMDIVCGPDAHSEALVADGMRVRPGAVLARVEGPAAGMLIAERTALNLLCHLSGVATATARWADALAGTDARVRDTRKTLPGLRQAQKYAVRTGGGHNQRLALWHGILIKENHIAAAGGVPQVMQQALALKAGVEIQIEVETLDQLRQALDSEATSVLLDNFPLPRVREAVALTAGRALLEVSGGVTLERLREIAATGVTTEICRLCVFAQKSLFHCKQFLCACIGRPVADLRGYSGRNNKGTVREFRYAIAGTAQESAAVGITAKV